MDEANQAQAQLQQDANNGGPGTQSDLKQLDKLQKCVQKAGQDVNRLNRCAQRFAP